MQDFAAITSKAQRAGFVAGMVQRLRMADTGHGWLAPIQQYKRRQEVQSYDAGYMQGMKSKLPVEQFMQAFGRKALDQFADDEFERQKNDALERCNGHIAAAQKRRDALKNATFRVCTLRQSLGKE